MKTREHFLKTVLLLLLTLSGIQSFAGPFYGVRMQPAPAPKPTHEEIMAQREAQRAAEEADVLQKQKYFVPRDPWRITTNQLTAKDGWIIQTRTNYAKGPHWYQFDGVVKAVLPDGIIVQGWMGPPMDFKNGTSNYLFVIRNFPYKVSPGITLSRSGNYVASNEGMTSHVYYPVSSSYLLCFDYGKISTPPTTASALADTTAPPPLLHHVKVHHSSGD